jgi:hypothetical protein
MYVERQEVSIASDGSGNGTGFTPIVTGHILAIRYVPDGTSPYDTGVDFVITGETSGIAVLTVTNAGTVAADYYPRAATATVANAAALYAAGGVAVLDRIPIAGERLKIAIAQATSAKVGKFHVFIG